MEIFLGALWLSQGAWLEECVAGEKRKRVSKARLPSLVFDVFQEEGWGQGGP